MPTQITEQITAYFTANTTGLVDGVDRAKKKLAELKRTYSERVANVRGSILDPSSLVTRGVDRLVGGMKLSAVTAGVFSAGFEIAASKLSEWRAEAAQAKQQADALSESVRQLSNANAHTTSADAGSSLIGRLSGLQDKQRELRQQGNDLHPVAPNDVAALNAKYLFNYGIHDNEHLQIDRATNEQQQRLIGKEEAKIRAQVTESLRRENSLTGSRLTLDQQSVRVLELQAAQEREINDLRAAGVGGKGSANENLVNQRYEREIEVQRTLGDALKNRFEMELGIAALQTSSLSTEQQGVVAAKARLLQVQDELATRKDLTEEETRAMALQTAAEQNTITLAQRAAERKSGAQLNREQFEQRKRQNENVRIDKRIDANDGLINIERGIGGNIVSGTDRITGERRAPSEDYLQRVARGGLATGGLSTGTLNRIPGTGTNAAKMKGGNQNDVSAGRTALDAQRATVKVLNKSNEFLKSILDKLTEGLNYS